MKTQYVKIPRSLIDDVRISPRAKIIMIMIIANASKNSVTAALLNLTSGFSSSTVSRAIIELREQGYCEILPDGVISYNLES